MASESSTAQTRPKVIIVGAGLGGLTLGLLLEKAKVPYVIFERAPAVKPLGSALALGDNVAPVFRQLGIYEDFTNVALVNDVIVARDENCKLDHIVDFSPGKVLGGAELRVVSRPVIYNILLSKIPKANILFNKRVLTVKHVETGVQIACSDNSVYEGDILVGADGANSAVRQGFYKQLKAEGRLPPSDDTPMPYNCICLVGQTTPLNPELFPELKNELCQLNNMCGIGKKYTWATFTTKYNTLCWMAIHDLDETAKKDHDTFRVSESSWGPEAAAAMCEEVRDFPIPNGPPGSTLGDLIYMTPKELISKVALEEKVFETWYSGRIVLMGDACHKFSPAGGKGATTAMHDAICLANWINVLPSVDTTSTEKIFREYYIERFPVAVDTYKTSRLFATFNAKNTAGAVARFIRRRMPDWIWLIVLKRLSSVRPQASFLPLVEDKGSIAPAPQRSLTKTLEILAAQGRVPQAVAL